MRKLKAWELSGEIGAGRTTDEEGERIDAREACEERKKEPDTTILSLKGIPMVFSLPLHLQ